jgi:hypothetical protein
MMKTLRVVDRSGNRRDYATDFVPRIGERVVLAYGSVGDPVAPRSRGGDPVAPHYFRVIDVVYRFDDPADHKAAILVEEETNSEPWPE